MALTYSWPGPTGLATTTDGRKDLAGLIETDASGVARSGVFPAHANALVAARSDMNVDIAAFQAVGVQFGGPILFANDAVAQLPSVLVSPGSGTNFYVIYAKQNESASPGTDANNNRVFGAALSTASFAAARATIPAGAVELATVQMPTGKTATNNAGVTITATHQFTAAEGGVVWVRNLTEAAAWSPADGAMAYQMDTKHLLQRVNGAWSWVSGASWRARKGSTSPLGTILSYVNVTSVTLPADAPPGVYTVLAVASTWSGTATTHFRQVRWGGTTLDGSGDSVAAAAAVDVERTYSWQVTHTGGAVTVNLDVQVNAGTPNANAACMLQVTYLGAV